MLFRTEEMSDRYTLFVHALNYELKASSLNLIDPIRYKRHPNTVLFIHSVCCV
jgi:hypothetical protein